MIAQRFSAGWAGLKIQSPFRDGTKKAGLESRKEEGKSRFLAGGFAVRS
jgi:hypothetical protein